jgi:methyl-accepting chemotaxis protein
VTRDIAANMHTASDGVKSISQNMHNIVAATKSAHEATAKVRDASLQLAS